jgi:hypothetical protein
MNNVVALQHESDLLRLVEYFTDELGGPKIRAAAEMLTALEYDGVVDCYGNTLRAAHEVSFGALSSRSIVVNRVHYLRWHQRCLAAIRCAVQGERAGLFGDHDQADG